MKPHSRHQTRILFVTVGSTKFDGLIERILSDECSLLLNELGFTRIVLQVGKSTYDQKQVDKLRKNNKTELKIYDYANSISNDIKNADVVIGHAGAGTCLEVLRLNKRLLVVINDTLMDNHQSELADQLAKENFVVKTTLDCLLENLTLICDTKLETFPQSDPKIFDKIFDEALKKVNSKM